jgi:aryl-alcohol dehydrogenase-like predicted oxidoreductase
VTDTPQTKRGPRGATPEGTATYRDAWRGETAAGHFREAAGGLVMSSIGVGTYLGDEDEITDALYGESIACALGHGCNVIDTAINYRCQRSERTIGRTLRTLVLDGTVDRSQIVIATKAGFLPFEDHVPANPQGYIHDTYVRAGIMPEADLVAGCHCMTPPFLEHQLRQSLTNLQTDHIDIYYLHNPETQLQEIEHDELQGRLRAAFAFLEDQADAGLIGHYGVATWNAFRRTKRAREYLSLPDLVRIAEDLRGTRHRFRFVQLPYNLAMAEARTTQGQVADGQRASLLEAAERLGITVVASASMLQGQLARLPADVAAAMPDLKTDAQRAIQFVRSTPGITTALVGMKGRRHVEENLAVARVAPDAKAVEGLLATAA